LWIYHQTVDAVRACCAEHKATLDETAAQSAAEIWAENAWLRAAENSGEDDPRERELWAIEDMVRWRSEVG
jgi:hypothetical protein